LETIHHKQHGSPELGPNNRYRVTFSEAETGRSNVVMVFFLADPFRAWLHPCLILPLPRKNEGVAERVMSA
jgi:hypothetical protein